jgi:hypothetical protein
MSTKEVTREEYLAFVNAWPNRLEFDIFGAGEPHVGTWNDFTTGKVWPQSVVASECREWLGPDGEIDGSYPGKFWRYFIRETDTP